ncbi:MAG: hypothetical protein IT514_07740 [Burkholderiales bacterium]|nr:hypothetical protein [Burkholderiales bacterium]
MNVLDGLHKLVARALPGLAYRERLAFSFNGGLQDMTEVEQLRAQLAAGNEQLLMARITQDIDAGRATIPMQNRFLAKHGKAASVERWAEFVTDCAVALPRQPAGPSRPTSFAGPDPELTTFAAGDPGTQIAELRERVAKEEGLSLADPVQFDRATKIVFRRHPAVAKAWANAPGEA